MSMRMVHLYGTFNHFVRKLCLKPGVSEKRHVNFFYEESLPTKTSCKKHKLHFFDSFKQYLSIFFLNKALRWISKCTTRIKNDVYIAGVLAWVDCNLIRRHPLSFQVKQVYELTLTKRIKTFDRRHAVPGS